MMRMLLVITAASLTFVSGLAYGMAGVGAGVSGFSWNQAAAEESARAGAAEGWCFPVILGLSMPRSTADAASEPSSHGEAQSQLIVRRRPSPECVTVSDG